MCRACITLIHLWSQLTPGRRRFHDPVGSSPVARPRAWALRRLPLPHQAPEVRIACAVAPSHFSAEPLLRVGAVHLIALQLLAGAVPGCGSSRASARVPDAMLEIASVPCRKPPHWQHLGAQYGCAHVAGHSDSRPPTPVAARSRSIWRTSCSIKRRCVGPLTGPPSVLTINAELMGVTAWLPVRMRGDRWPQDHRAAASRLVLPFLVLQIGQDVGGFPAIPLLAHAR